MKPGDDDDPIMVNIRKSADLLRYICTNTDTHGPDACSKGQLFAMLEEVRAESETILKLTGISNLERHFEETWDHLIEDRGIFGSRLGWQPYSETR